MFYLSLSFQSCESENDPVYSGQDDKSSERIVKSNEPVLNSTWTVEASLISQWSLPENPCFEFQINFYWTFEGNTYLVHSAIMKTCKEVKSGESTDCEGIFKGDEIVRDYRINGCIKDFLITQPGAYGSYKLERDKLIARMQ